MGCTNTSNVNFAGIQYSLSALTLSVNYGAYIVENLLFRHQNRNPLQPYAILQFLPRNSKVHSLPEINPGPVFT